MKISVKSVSKRFNDASNVNYMKHATVGPTVRPSELRPKTSVPSRLHATLQVVSRVYRHNPDFRITSQELIQHIAARLAAAAGYDSGCGR